MGEPLWGARLRHTLEWRWRSGRRACAIHWSGDDTAVPAAARGAGHCAKAVQSGCARCLMRGRAGTACLAHSSSPACLAHSSSPLQDAVLLLGAHQHRA
jgi:hypothetical protein